MISKDILLKKKKKMLISSMYEDMLYIVTDLKKKIKICVKLD